MLEHHGGVEAAIPQFRGAVASGFKSEVVLHTLVAAFRGSSGIILQLPLFRISGRDVEEPGIVLHGKVDGAAPFGVGAWVRTGARFGAAVHQGTAEFGTAFGKVHAVMAHFKTSHANGHTVGTNGEIIFIFELNAPLFIECNEGHDTLPAAVFIDRHSIMGGVKEQLGDSILGQKSLHSEEAVKKTVGVMAGSGLEQRKYRQIAD